MDIAASYHRAVVQWKLTSLSTTRRFTASARLIICSESACHTCTKLASDQNNHKNRDTVREIDESFHQETNRFQSTPERPLACDKIDGADSLANSK